MLKKRIVEDNLSLAQKFFSLDSLTHTGACVIACSDCIYTRINPMSCMLRNVEVSKKKKIAKIDFNDFVLKNNIDIEGTRKSCIKKLDMNRSMKKEEFYKKCNSLSKEELEVFLDKIIANEIRGCEHGCSSCLYNYNNKCFDTTRYYLILLAKEKRGVLNV